MLNRNKIIAGAIVSSMFIGAVSPQLAYASENKNSDYYQTEQDSAHSAKDKNNKTWYYSNLKNGTIAIYGTKDVDSYLEVPETLDGKTVTVIEYIVSGVKSYDSDYGKKEAVLKKIKLPKTIKIIDDTAFSLCKNLTDIEMPENVQMSEYVFKSCPGVRVNGHANNTNINTPTDVSNLSKGWNTFGTNKYYVNPDGKLQTGWMNMDGKKYYFYGNGQMATGFINLGDGAYYYLDPSSGANMGNLITGWKIINGYWYYFNLNAQGKKERGYMQTGWLYNNGSWYYFYGNGQMATGFIKLGDDAYYYLDESSTGNIGIMKTGWQSINSYWYYFNKSGDSGYEGMMRKGWQRINGNWYYFYYGDGKMAHDAWIDGYYVSSSGVWE